MWLLDPIKTPEVTYNLSHSFSWDIRDVLASLKDVEPTEVLPFLEVAISTFQLFNVYSTQYSLARSDRLLDLLYKNHDAVHLLWRGVRQIPIQHTGSNTFILLTQQTIRVFINDSVEQQLPL